MLDHNTKCWERFCDSLKLQQDMLQKLPASQLGCWMKRQWADAQRRYADCLEAQKMSMLVVVNTEDMGGHDGRGGHDGILA
jgi:hypothetical protein